MQPTFPNPQPEPRRTGFTMVEILIVITIIAILFSISFVVLGDSLEKARIDGTRTVIRQLDSLLHERLEALDSLNLRSQAQQFRYRYNINKPAANPPVSLKVAEIMVAKDRFRGALPQRLEDLWGFDGMPDLIPGQFDDSPLWTAWIRNYQTVANRRTAGPAPMIPDSTLAGARPPMHRADLENIELLVFSLTRAGVFGAPPLTMDSIPAKYVRDTPLDWNGDGVVTNDLYPTGDDLEGDAQANGNDIPEIYDEWEHPIRFYNWPTRLVRPAGPGMNIDDAVFEVTVRPLIPELLTPIPTPLPFDLYSHPLNQDPDDQTGALSAAYLAGFFNSTFSLGGPNPAQPYTEDYYSTLDTAHVPLIISAGPDERLGLEEPVAAGANRLATVTVRDQLTDNITNRQR